MTLTLQPEERTIVVKVSEWDSTKSVNLGPEEARDAGKQLIDLADAMEGEA